MRGRMAAVEVGRIGVGRSWSSRGEAKGHFRDTSKDLETKDPHPIAKDGTASPCYTTWRYPDNSAPRSLSQNLHLVLPPAAGAEDVHTQLFCPFPH